MANTKTALFIKLFFMKNMRTGGLYTTGCTTLQRRYFDSSFSFPLFSLAALLTGWGGLSVHFQSLALLSGGKAKGALHLTGRLLSASIGAVLGYLAGLLLL